jgi:Fe-S-cluster containining protein
MRIYSRMKPELLKKFRCTGCGECCRWPGSVLLTGPDITVLAEQLALSEEQFISRHTRLAFNRIQLALNERADGSCIFLEKNRCSVYAARPRQCRSFPFEWRVPHGCPALDELLADQNSIESAAEKP